MDKWPKVFIVVLNWNGWRDTVECLESLLFLEYPNYKIVVVDNGSSDNSLQYMIKWAKGNINIESKFIASRSKKPVKFSSIVWQGLFTPISDDALITFIENKRNSGYAGGNNIGIRYASKNKADFVFILNNDTVVDKNILIEFLSAYQTLGPACYGAKFYYYSRPKTVQFSGVKLNFLSMRFVHSHTDVRNFKEIDYAFGAGFFLPYRIIEEVGLFDERLFLYEETDLCYRVKRKGYKVILVPKAVIYHKGSCSFQKSKISVEYFDTRSRFLWVEKHLNIYWRIWLFLVFLFELQRCLRYGAGLTRSFIFKKSSMKEKTRCRFLKFKMKVLGFKDYILHRFYTLP